MPRMTRSQLIRAILHDLVMDARCADKKNDTAYASQCRDAVARWFPRRHTLGLDTFGWPLQVAS
jgi:hypothetical protein